METTHISNTTERDEAEKTHQACLHLERILLDLVQSFRKKLLLVLHRHDVSLAAGHARQNL